MSKAKAQQMQEDAVKNESTTRKALPLLVSQFGSLILLLLKLKSWRLVFLCVPGLLSLGILYVPKVFLTAKFENAVNSSLTLYGLPDLLASGHVVLTNFAADTSAAASILKETGGKANLFRHCALESECRAKFISETDASVIAYLSYSSTPSKPSVVLECLWVKDSTLRCAVLHQLVTQSVGRNAGTDRVFRDVKFFYGGLIVPSKQENSSRGLNEAEKQGILVKQRSSLGTSYCAGLVNSAGAMGFVSILTLALSASLVSTAIGVAFHFLVSTLFCIRALKSNGFYQQLVRDGLSPTLFLATVWLLIAVECLVLSGTYVLSHVVFCPGFYPAAAMLKVFAYVYFYFASFGVIVVLLELLVQPVMAIFMLIIVTSIGLLFAFFSHAWIKQKMSFISNIFPLIDAQKYALTYMTSHLAAPKPDAGLVLDERPYQTMLACIGMFVLVIALLSFYLDHLLRAGNGMCLPASFPLRPAFWCPGGGRSKDADQMGDTTTTEPHIESVIGFLPSIEVDRVSKAYGGICCSAAGPTVLNGLSCKIYRNHITALIGHNGAGKSTLIKILTGEECPDKGSAYINGIRVTDPLARLALRGCISICPQFDALCGELTVIDSIQLTLHCKGASGSSQLERARGMLRSLGLGDKEDVRSTDLSGGQKRKLNTILALLGEPDVVFLDEPTSGLDPVSRRQLWQLLQEEKVGRSIVLCTQFMDEADVLADRKIFLCGGQIVCAGSSMFLKRAFGCSFTVNVSLRSKSDAATLLASLGQVASLKSQLDTELQLEVPASKPSALLQAVQVLESSQGIAAFGVSQANLDDIFMKLSGVDSAEIIAAFRSGQLSNFFNKKGAGPSNDDTPELGLPLDRSKQIRSSICRQFSALLGINLKRQVRTRSSIVSRFVIPAILLILLGVVILPKDASPPPVKRSATEVNPDARFDGRNMSEVRFIGYLAAFSTIVCVHDELDTSLVNQTCASLAALYHDRRFAIKPPLLLKKNLSESLQSFLTQGSTIETLIGNFCTHRCVIYYASSWDRSEPNSRRSIIIGMFAEARNSEDKLPGFGKAFDRISRIFGAGDLNVTNAKVTYIKPLSRYEWTDIDIVIFLVIFSLFPASYLSDPIEDISSRVRAYLVSMGMTHLAYWMNMFWLHWIQYAVCFTLSVGILCIRQQYRNAYFIIVSILTLFLGTSSNQLTMYTVAAVTRQRSTIVSLFCNVLCLVLPVVFIKVVTASPIGGFIMICLVPQVAPTALLYLSLAFAVYNMDYYYVDSVSDIPDLFANCWTNSHILLSTVIMPAHIAIMCGIIAMAENSQTICASRCCRRNPADAEKSVQLMDQGAQKEADRVLQSVRDPRNVLEVRQLCMTYPNGVRAVRGVTFATMAGEIFGLLGANGAGKSTSMSMIVGEESATSGECEVRAKDGSWVSARSGASAGAIGYCPQHNPLFDNVTVAEHVRLYANIRGVPSADVEGQATALIRSLGLEQHRNKGASQLSGGNKRRLCLTIALLGDPALVVIDEASTGVDPENKRFIWTAIRGMLSKQRTVMITTHSMEEVEALCSRVGIMNKGRMIAFGTVQQLRSAYGDAYTLDVLLKQLTTDSEDAVKKMRTTIKSAVATQFKGAVVLDELSLCIQFYIPKAAVTQLSSALQWLTANQTRLGMDYYSFYQMSLDQVFVKLVKQFDASSGAD